MAGRRTVTHDKEHRTGMYSASARKMNLRAPAARGGAARSLI